MSNKSKIFIISAPSGAGKSTIIDEILKKQPILKKPVSYTTRKPRGNEKDGVDYNFLSVDEFLKMKNNGEFAEWAKVHNNFYATSINSIKEAINGSKYLIKDIDTQGALNLKQLLDKDVILIFINTPSINELEKRLKNRSTDAQEVINARLKNASKEIEMSDKYDHIVINDIFDNAVKEILEIINGYIKNE